MIFDSNPNNATDSLESSPAVEQATRSNNRRWIGILMFTVTLALTVAWGLYFVRTDHRGIFSSDKEVPKLFPVCQGCRKTTYKYVDGRWGFIDANARLTISMQFDEVHDFSEGLAAVRVGDRWGFIDETGHYVINPQFAFVTEFSEGLASARGVKHDFGFIDRTGKYVIPPQFEFAGMFRDGLADVQLGEKWGFIGKDGTYRIAPQFDRVDPFKEGLAAVKIGQKWGYIDKAGKYVINPQFDGANSFHTDGVATVRLGDNWGFIDKGGQYTINPQFENTSGFSEGLAAVRAGGKWGFVDKGGQYTINPQFDDANGFSEGLAAVRAGGKWGFIDRAGRFVIPPSLNGEDVGHFQRGLVSISPFFYINAKGDPAWPDPKTFKDDLEAIKPLLIAIRARGGPFSVNWVMCVNEVTTRPLCGQVVKGDPLGLASGVFNDQTLAKTLASHNLDALIIEDADGQLQASMNTSPTGWIRNRDLPAPPDPSERTSPAASESSDPVFSDESVVIESIDKKPYYSGCILSARIRNKTSLRLGTVIVHLNVYDASGALTGNPAIVVGDIPPFGVAQKDMTGSLLTMPARVEVVNVID